MNARFAGGTLVLLLAATAAAADDPVVTVEKGALRGRIEDGAYVFRGIPFAAPPTGSLRWRAPQPPAPWEGVRDAGSFGSPCVQFPVKPRPDPAGMDEDCLYLNVWAPAAKEGRPYPVMVWIHGGAGREGSGSLDIFSGRTLVKEGVVYVSFNYRLGYLGFFAHPELVAETPDGPVGNYWLMDQIRVLEWVRDNIAAFGGDPDNVTVFGESAGGVGVQMLMICPAAKGLFHRAIAESAGGYGPLRRLASANGSYGSALDAGVEFAKSRGVEGPGALARLRALSWREILGSDGPAAGLGEFVIINDGRLIPNDLDAQFLAGFHHDVPFLVGANSYEGSLLGAAGVAADEIIKASGLTPPQLERLYGTVATENRQFLAGFLVGDSFGLAPARAFARDAAGGSAPSFLYHFSYVPAPYRKLVPGAVHGAEVAYVLGTVDALGTLVPGFVATEEDWAISRQMVAYWTAFAKTGDPNGEGRVRWPAYDEKRPVTLEFGNDGVVQRPDFLKERLDLHDRLWRQRRGLTTDLPH